MKAALFTFQLKTSLLNISAMSSLLSDAESTLTGQLLTLLSHRIIYSVQSHSFYQNSVCMVQTSLACLLQSIGPSCCRPLLNPRHCICENTDNVKSAAPCLKEATCENQDHSCSCLFMHPGQTCVSTFPITDHQLHRQNLREELDSLHHTLPKSDIQEENEYYRAYMQGRKISSLLFYCPTWQRRTNTCKRHKLLSLLSRNSWICLRHSYIK